MADGVFNNTDEIGNTIKQGLMLRYQAQQKAQEDARQTSLANLRARGELLGRLTLSQPGGGAAPFSDYLSALNGGDIPAGTTAQPTPAFGAAVRANAQDNASQQRSHAELVKNLTKYDTSKWSQGDYATYFGTGQLPAGAKPIEKPVSGGKGGGKSPEQVKLEALKATAASLYKQLGVASKEDANRMFSSLRSLSPEQQHIKSQLAQIDAETSKLGGLGAGAGAGGQVSPDQWNQKWAALTPGQSMVGLDGKTYTKR